MEGVVVTFPDETSMREFARRYRNGVERRRPWPRLALAAGTENGGRSRTRARDGLPFGASSSHTGQVAKWNVDDTRPVEPTPGADCDTSYLLKLSRGERRARSTVEFTAPSSVASSGWAREALAPYLVEDEPPQRLIVGLDGTVRVPTDAV